MADFELIIFDCDGVLVDSELLANQVFADVLRQESGLSFTLGEMFQVFLGRSSSQCMDIIEDLLGKKPPAGLEERYKNQINRALEQSVKAIFGVEQAIAQLSTPYCIASSGSYEKMNTTLGKTHLLQYFSGKLYSSSDVARGKPFPDVYLHAAHNMGVVDATKCLVIEDSSIGVQGGVAAGMTVFGYAELMDHKRLTAAGAHHIFRHMDDLIDDIKHYVCPRESSQTL